MKAPRYVVHIPGGGLVFADDRLVGREPTMTGTCERLYDAQAIAGRLKCGYCGRGRIRTKRERCKCCGGLNRAPKGTM